MAECKFDLSLATQMAESFTQVTGVNCCVASTEGLPFYHTQPLPAMCALCQSRSVCPEARDLCHSVHQYGAYQAERFGGRYIYFCPACLTYFSSPILREGTIVGSLVGGPVLTMAPEDYWDGPLPGRLTPDGDFSSALSQVPARAPELVSHLSNLLFASTVSVSDSSYDLLRQGAIVSQQQEIGEFILQYKQSRPSTYPIQTERELISSVAAGNELQARSLLNELLSYIFFSSGSMDEISARTTELLVLLSRAALEAGADTEQIFGLNSQLLKELRCQKTIDGLCFWLSSILHRFIDLVFGTVSAQHKDIIYKSMQYIRAHVSERIALEDVAAYVGFSAPYFSRVFKRELGQNFSHYLNDYRISKSKELLLSGDVTVEEICQAVGFDDPSYFSKVFRRYTGVSPGKFRMRRGQLDPSRERDSALD